MRLDNFDLNLLVAFEALLEERSVTRAAERLNVTQSAMSASLKRLRMSFNDELLILHGRKMRPTPHALALAPDVSATLVRLRSVITTSTRFDPATSNRQFRVNASDYITTVLLSPVIEILQLEAPGVRLDLSLPDRQSWARLEAGDIDIILTPDEFLQSDNPRELLFEEHYVVAGWRENPMMRRPLSQEQFLNSGHVGVRIAGKDAFIEMDLKRIMPERRIEVWAQSFIQVPWLLRGTYRLSVMHKRLAKMMAPALDLAYVNPPFDLSVMKEMMQYHVTDTNDAGLRWLRTRLMDYARRG